MKPIERSEVLGLADYETIRSHFRSRVIGQKKRRRIALGSKATALFENRDTVLLQIQEILRTERITRTAAVMHEIETYNEIVPGDDELSCTLMIEIADKAERDAFLRAAIGLENAVSLVVGETRVHAHPLTRGSEPADRTTAMHYLKFKLTTALAMELRAAAPPPGVAIALEVAHSAYRASVTLPPDTVAELIDDLRA